MQAPLGKLADPSADLLELGLNDAPVGILVVADDGHVAYANPEACAIFGYDEAEFRQIGLSALIPKRVRAAHSSWVQQYLEKPERRRMGIARRLTGIRRDGTPFQCEIGLNPVNRHGRGWVVASITQICSDESTLAQFDEGLQRWRFLLEQLGDRIWIWNLDDDSAEISPGWCADLGYSPEELTCASQWIGLLHDAEREFVVGRLNACLSGEIEDFDEEFRLRHRNGNYRWVRARGKVVERAIDGRPRRMLGIFQETTARRVAEAAQRDAELRWRYALEGSGAGVWDWDLETDDVYFSPGSAAVLGYESSPLEPPVATWRRRVHPDDLKLSDQALASCLAGKTSEYRAECRIFAPDGSFRWILYRGLVVEWMPDAQKPRRMIGTLEDITAAKRREADLLESREHTRRIAALVPGVAYQYKCWPDGRDCFPFASDGMRQVYGVDPVDVLNDASLVLDRLHPADRAAVQAAIAHSARTFTRWAQEYRILLPDGSVRWLSGVADPLPELEPDGAIVWHGHIVDVTERKQRDLALERRTRALELANADLEQFNYVASHDLKEPMRGIRYLVDWIAEDLPEQTPTSVHTNLERLRARVDRLQALVADLAVYSRVGRKDVELTQIALRDWVSEICEELDLRGCRVDWSRVADERLLTSAMLLRTVLSNLLLNAAVHHDRSAQGLIRISATVHSDDLRFAVEDDGPGIDSMHHDRIFRMYQQLNPERDSEGTGSGLTIVKRIVNSVGSSIEVISPLTERGTRFVFSWPRQWPRD